MMHETKVFLNTWGAYNNGSIGYGWMTPEEARDFIEENEERDGGEWFVADIDNYLGVDFGNLDYCNVMDILETIETLEEMEECERDEVVALMEYLGTDDVNEAIEKIDEYIFYSDVDSFYDCMDELLDFSGCNELLERYFDFDAYHRDCMYDVTECSNGIVISNY